MTNNQLKSLIERIEKLEGDKRSIADDIKDVYAEAKGNGFNPKILRKVVALRRQDAEKRLVEQTLISTYMDALGMLADTPLGQAAIRREFE